MDLLNIIILALVQGLTEFLPISSSAHLVVVPAFIEGLSEQGIGYDVLMHLGTLCAAVLYLRKDILPATISGHNFIQSARELLIAGGYLSISVIPLAAVAVTFDIEQHSALRTLPTIALSNLVFATALLIAWLYHQKNTVNGISASGFVGALKPQDVKQWSWLMAGLLLLCGLIQAFAIIPGASRSGLIITLALLLRMRLSMAIFLAFFTAIPSIAGSLVWLGLKTDLGDMDILASIVAFTCAGLAGYMAMKWFASAIVKWGVMPFFYYRLGLSLALAFYIIWV